MNRRIFAFWIGLTLFRFSRSFGAESLDSAAATIMEWSETKIGAKRERWKPNANYRWRWYERQTLINGQWRTSGLTTPEDRHTGVRYDGASGYLSDELVPANVRQYSLRTWKKFANGRDRASDTIGEGQPPSKWLRSLDANELRLWLRTVRLPEVGVEGMSYWTHLTRDHSFSAARIRGLTISEQARLHSAAHYGF